MSTTTETVRARLRQYKRREAMTVWVGAGFAGLLAVLSLDIATGPAWAVRGTLTLILLGASALAMARVGFEWKASIIERHIEDAKITPDSTYPSDSGWPTDQEAYWTAALWLMLLSGLGTLLVIWLPVWST